MTNFAHRIRDLRYARKLTQPRLADLHQGSPRVYGHWESGDVPKRSDISRAIADGGKGLSL